MFELFLGLIALVVCVLLTFTFDKLDEIFGDGFMWSVFVVLVCAYFIGKVITVIINI